MTDARKEKRPLCRLWLTLTIIFGLINLCIPSFIGMMLCTVPLWASLLAAAAFIGSAVMLVLTAPKRRKTAIVAGIATVLVLAVTALGCMLNPYFNSVSRRSAPPTRDGAETVTLQQAEEDMEQLMSTLRRIHPAFMEGTPAEVSAAYDRAMTRLQEADALTTDDVHRALQSTVSVLGDAHTNIYTFYTEPHYRSNGIELNAKGYSLYAVDGQPLEEVLRSRSELFSYEAESWGLDMLRQQLSSAEGLRYLGYDLDRGVTYSFENGLGEPYDYTYTADDFLTYDECLALSEQYLEDEPEQPAASAYYEIDTDRDAAILTLTSCDYSDEYCRLLRELFTEMKNTGVSNLIIDLRGNGGGSSLVADELIRYLPVDSYLCDTYKHRLGFIMLEHNRSTTKNKRVEELTFDGEVYLLTDSGSFSSAMLFALYFKDNKLGTLVGEAPGNAPNGYGEIATFRMDNTGLYLSVSTKQFLRPDRACTDLLVEPDVPCDGDVAMAKVFELIDGDQ